MAMTKQDFIALADLIREHNQYHSTTGERFARFQLERLADFCQSQNPRFNRERWLGYIAGTNGASGQTNIPGERI